MVLSFYFNLIAATQCSIKLLSFEDSKLRNSIFRNWEVSVESSVGKGLGVPWVEPSNFFSHLPLFSICCICISFIFICRICCICLQGRNPRSPLPWSSVFRVTVIEGCPEPGRLVFSVICPLCLPGWSLDMNILKISTPEIVPIFFNVAIIISGGYQYSRDIIRWDFHHLYFCTRVTQESDDDSGNWHQIHNS